MILSALLIFCDPSKKVAFSETSSPEKKKKKLGFLRRVHVGICVALSSTRHTEITEIGKAGSLPEFRTGFPEFSTKYCV
jgi:hypothetical protein